ncbi:MAG: hypothetical protein U1E73_00500 [Planctomycetota bacterium]
MDALNRTSGIDPRLGVHERPGGRRGDPEAFRRALQQGAADGQETAPEPPPAKAEKPVRRGLQPPTPDSRQQEQPRHIDVYA